MLGSTRPEAKQLRSQLNEYLFIVEVNQELVDKNVDAREKLASKFRAAEVLLDQFEHSGEKEDYIVMLYEANLIVDEICDNIKDILSQDTP